MEALRVKFDGGSARAGRGLGLVSGAVLAILLLGGAPACTAATPAPLLFGHVYAYKGQTAVPYKGRLAFRILWPHVAGLKCFALYVPSRPSNPQATPGAPTAAGGGSGAATPATPLAPPGSPGGGQSTSAASPSSGSTTRLATVLVFPPAPYVSVTCRLASSPPKLLTVMEFRAGALKTATAGLKPFRLGRRTAYASAVPTQGDERIATLYLRQGALGVELQGLAPISTLEKVARSLRD